MQGFTLGVKGGVHWRCIIDILAICPHQFYKKSLKLEMRISILILGASLIATHRKVLQSCL